MKGKTAWLLLAGANLWLCACRQAPATPKAATYSTLVVKEDSCTLTQEYAARLEGQQVVEIRPQVGGLIMRICFDEGQRVRKGQTLFLIDPVPYRAALDAATANLANAEAQRATAQMNLESMKMLYEKHVVQAYDLGTARNEMAQAEAAVAQAQAQLTNARNNLSYTEVKSPVDGVAGMISYRVGALVDSNISEPLVTVSDDSRMYAYFSMTERQIAWLTEQYGSPEEFMNRTTDVGLRTAGGLMYAEPGRIAAMSGIVNAGTGTVMVRADFPNPKACLRDGGSATVVLTTTREQAIVIPQSATYELQNRKFVYKVVDGKAQSVPVELYRLNNGTEYIVEEGLETGDRIIAEGAGLVKEGAVVNLQTGKE